MRLQQDLLHGRYKHGAYDHFIVNESKRRDIAVANVRDRVVHRLLYDYLVVMCDARFDYDVWSCRLGKGNVAALERTRELLQRYASAYVWRGDVHKFFDSINHGTLKQLLKRYELGEHASALLDEVIDSYCLAKGTGIPIGNLTSQILANIYLHEFDYFVRHSLKPLAYIRYGDDFLLISATPEEAFSFQSQGKAFLEDELLLTLHARNNVVIPVRKGVRYLGITTYATSETLSLKAFEDVKSKISRRNYTSYLTYVKRYGNQKQRIKIRSVDEYWSGMQKKS